MNIWIDASGVPAAETLFGVPPLERLRRSVRPSADGGTVAISGSSPASWPGARVEVDSAPLGTRLRRALLNESAPLIVLDGANVIDPRLILFLGRGDDAVVAQRGEGASRAVAMRLVPALVDAIPPTVQ